MLTRREFGKVAGTGALALGIGEISMGVSCETVFTDIANYVPIGVNSFNQILTLISPAEATLLAPITALVKGSFADLAAAVAEYNAAPAADKASLKGKITTAIQAVIDNLNKFWADANLPNGTLASTIIGVLQIVLSTLAAFVPLLGGVVATTVSKKAIQIVPRAGKQLQAKQVKSDINAVFAAHGYPNHIY